MYHDGKVVSSETVILTAIHKIKANKGSRTAGSDDETISDYSEEETSVVPRKTVEEKETKHKITCNVKLRMVLMERRVR